jgi:hypothetical protein
MAVVETRRQPTRIVTQSLDVGITTTKVKTIVVTIMDVVKRGILIGFITILDSGLCGVSTKKKLNGSMALPTTTIRVVGTLQMVFTNPIMTIFVNRITDRPSMSSMVNGGYKSENVVNLKGGYQKPFIVTALIFYHRDGHYVRPNRITFKYPDFKKLLIQIFMSECLIL